MQTFTGFLFDPESIYMCYFQSLFAIEIYVLQCSALVTRSPLLTSLTDKSLSFNLAFFLNYILISMPVLLHLSALFLHPTFRLVLGSSHFVQGWKPPQPVNPPNPKMLSSHSHNIQSDLSLCLSIIQTICYVCLLINQAATIVFFIYNDIYLIISNQGKLQVIKNM